MKAQIELSKTALILIGFQNDYFADDGILRGVIEASERNNHVLENTLALINTLDESSLIIHTPIVFTEDYSELHEPIGILEAIKNFGAFQQGKKGSETIPEISNYGTRILEIPGKRGLNAFSNTKLDDILNKNEIENIVLAGAVTSICIDSTGRSAFEKGYNVYILEDCTCSRTINEQEFYCAEIFPIYAKVIKSEELKQITQ